MTARWDPDQYLRYAGERQRPFAELLARIRHPDPREVVDLGCGPGTTTADLARHWPDAHVVGVDSSAEMIAHAQPHAIPDRLEFRHADLRDWTPDRPVDVLVSAATLQWVPGHVSLFPRFMESLGPQGVFAFQVPGNFAEPSHTLLRELAQSERWRPRLGDLARPAPVLSPPDYLSALLDAGADGDVWETTYLHILSGHDAVLEWVRGSALRPYLTALGAADGPTDDSVAFIATYAAGLRAAYPHRADGRTVFPFRRIFGIATMPPGPAEADRGTPP